jgi:hypothetical protein
MKIFGLRIMTEWDYQEALFEERNKVYLSLKEEYREVVATLIMEKQALQDKIDGARILKNSYVRHGKIE